MRTRILAMAAVALLTTVVPAAAASVDVGDRAGASVTLTRVTKTPVVTGATVTFKGQAPRRAAGEPVRLFRRVNKAEWVRVATKKVAADGAFRISGTATGVGTNSWRAVTLVGNDKVTSAVDKHKVYQWFAMDDENAVEWDGWNYIGDKAPVRIGSKTFPRGVMGDGAHINDEGVAWNLSYKCIRFKTSYGMENESETGSVGSFSVILDGATTTLPNKGLGDPTRLTMDVSTRMRLTIYLNVVSDDTYPAYPTFANPSVLCSGRPF